MRTARSTLDNKTTRLRFRPRKYPYFATVGPRTTLGYARAPDPSAGTWYVREYIDGLYKQVAIGTADDHAPANGRDVLSYAQAVARAAQGLHGSVSRRRGEALTVESAVTQYLAALAARSAHSKEAEQRAKKHITPTLGRHRVANLTKTQIENWRAGLVKSNTDEDSDAKRRSQDTANRILTLLKAALNHAFADDSSGIPSDTAWRRVKAFRSVGAAREDHFDAAQVKVLIAKAATFDRAFANLIEAAYLTGARLGELTALDVRDFDAERGILSIRDGKTGARPVVLSPESVAFFRRLAKDRTPRAVLLPRADGARWGKSEQFRPFRKAAALAELPASASFYSLRHSHISRAIEALMPLSLLAENVGTSLGMIEKNYAKMLASTRRELVGRTAPRLRRVK